MNKVPDDLLEDLGEYFEHYEVLKRQGIPFHLFVDQYMAGQLQGIYFLIPMEGAEETDVHQNQQHSQVPIS
ncbi:hypothetical protein [Paenibacillus sp. FSL R7-0333]|uniref:hypothetical protein n=1 Tax=Paenibacillus sp. FSL R7-0333 TaxID=1926587 RepID=UPI00096FB386|nr:hypothetical protein BK146_16855 [Paenibacillus sp. FSL R7-0333]